MTYKEIGKETGFIYVIDHTSKMEDDCLGRLRCVECMFDKYWVGRDGLHGYENFCPCCGAKFV